MKKRFAIYDLRLTSWLILLTWFGAAVVQAAPIAPASQAEVNSGIEPWKYVTPATLNAWKTNAGVGGTNVYNYFTPSTVTVSSVTNVPAGGAATVAVSGTNNMVFSFGIPIGATGATGETGATGSAGANGTNGTNGLNGINGTNGLNGVNGTNGIALIYSHVFTNIAQPQQAWAHSYGKAPLMVWGLVNCITNDGGMAAGQSVGYLNVQDAARSQPYFQIGSDGTNLYEGSVSTLAADGRINWAGQRNTITNWANFTLTIVYQ